MRKYILLLFLLLVSGTVFYIGVVNEVILVKRVYLLPYIWGCLVLICLECWRFSAAKALVILHFLVLCSGAFSFLLYRLFLLFNATPALKEHESFYTVASLMFDSENVCYPTVYAGFLLFIIDLVLVLRRRRREQPQV